MSASTPPAGLVAGMAAKSAGLSEESNKLKNNSLDLGRIFEMAIDNFIKDRGDIDGQVVMGACNYIIQTYKERMTAAGEKYGRLKRIIETEGIKIHEPYVNDGIESANTGIQFDPGGNSLTPGGLRTR